jgi:hypothetical protein
MSTRRTPVALAIVALIGAGCSNGSAEETATATPTGHDRGVTYAACMRDNGITEFPDPDPSEGLTIDGVVNGSSLDPSSPAWEAAIAACKDLQPPGFMGDEKPTPAQQGKRLAFARCMRDHGVEDFPDPVPGEPLVNTNVIPSSAEPGGMDVLNAAMQTCGDLAAAAMGRR